MENLKIKNLIIGLLIVLVIAGTAVYWSRTYKKIAENSQIQSPSQVKLEYQPEIQKPLKTSFGNQMPQGFIEGIPVESDAKIEQSYGLNYQNQKQLSLVFQSENTVSKNYEIYYDYLIKDKWNIINNNRGENLSSLYARKEGRKINVTIFYDESFKKAKVSISVLEG